MAYIICRYAVRTSIFIDNYNSVNISMISKNDFFFSPFYFFAKIIFSISFKSGYFFEFIIDFKMVNIYFDLFYVREFCDSCFFFANSH